MCKAVDKLGRPVLMDWKIYKNQDKTNYVSYTGTTLDTAKVMPKNPGIYWVKVAGSASIMKGRQNEWPYPMRLTYVSCNTY
jgi:hypothetical protein